MNEHVETPQKGQPLRASWAAAVAARLNSPGVSGASGMLSRDGCGVGFDLLPENLRSRNLPRPFKVAGSSEDDYKFAIYVPENVVSIGEEIVTPTGISAIEGATDWYSLDDEDDVGDDGSTLYLVAYDDDSAEFTFDLDGAVGGAGSGSSEKKIVAVLPIAELATQELGERTYGVVKRQLACHPFTVGVRKGSGSGETGDVLLATGLEYDTTTHEFKFVPRTLHFVDGLYQGYDDDTPLTVFTSVAHGSVY